MTLTHEKYVLACALLVEKQEAERAPVYIAEQIGALALRGDAAGIDMWKQVATLLGRRALVKD